MPTPSDYTYLKGILDNIPDMAWLKDIDSRFILVNRPFAEACGVEVGEVVGKTDLDVWPAELAAKYIADDREVMHTGLSKTVEEPLVDVKGETRWIETTKSPVYDDEGRIIGTTGIARDITKRKRAETALESMSHEFTALLENTTDFVYMKDENSRFRFCSQSLAKLTGHDNWRELIGKHDREIFPARLARIYSREEQKVIREGTPVLDRIDPYCDVHGNRGWVHTNKWPTFNSDRSKVVGVFGISRDITQRKQAERQIRKLNADLKAYAAELEEANQDMEAFSYSVTHDLRKPLTIINGYSQVILQLCGGALDEDCTRYLQQIYEGTLRMNQLIDAVLRFSVVKRGELHPETVDLTDIAEKTAEELKLTEADRKVTFIFAKGITAEGDRNLLQVVMANLLGNAWKYTGNQEEAVIEFGLKEVSGSPAYFVRDNGIGFDMAHAGKLFTPFQRLEGAAAFQGDGIGLATVERIIRRHGGRIWAESEPDRGATFYFQLGQPGVEELE